jgi:shikimate kinase
MRIFLIGFMGSGKSAMGAALAQELGLSFIDLDKNIENSYGKDIPAIFAADGEKRFRELEQQALTDALEQDNYVMACGGGTPCFFDNLAKMNDAGVTVYLKMSSDSLIERLEMEVDKRPLLMGKKGHELGAFVQELLLEREKDYLKAKYKVKNKDLKPSELAEFIRLYELQEVEEDTDGEEE